jgi:prepilin-type N-terminal cleavage/methylation domain-containing protein
MAFMERLTTSAVPAMYLNDGFPCPDHKTPRIILKMGKMNPQTPATSAPIKPTPPAWGSPRPRSGFTLIELLVVIGIILLLMGLLYTGVKIVTAQAKEKDTRTMLETCKTMFENYRNATHLTRPPPVGRGAAMAINTSNPSCPPSITTASFWTVGQEAAPSILSTDPSTYSNPANYNTMPPNQVEALVNTALVMYAMKSLPENATILTNVPASKTFNVSILLKSGPGSPNVTLTIPLLLDGWGNPILFVPGGGFGSTTLSPGVVYVDGTTNFGIITSTGVITSTTTPYSLPTYDPANVPLGTTLPNQPFFVSAGPDGDFTNSQSKTDDNIYSFK